MIQRKGNGQIPSVKYAKIFYSLVLDKAACYLINQMSSAFSIHILVFSCKLLNKMEPKLVFYARDSFNGKIK